MQFLKNNLLSKILIIVVVLPICFLFVSKGIGALFFSQVLESDIGPKWFFATMFCNSIGFFCGLIVSYKIWPKKKTDQTTKST